MNTAFLLTGSNMGNREQQLANARELLKEQCGTIVRVSSLYETAAWGNTDQPLFLNQAIELQTVLSARQLMRKILKAEKQLGRVRKEKYGPRSIDIDILLYNDEIHNYTLLTLPHPEMQNRRFALLPLNEIAPEVVHPVLQKTVSRLLIDCTDHLAVSAYC